CDRGEQSRPAQTRIFPKKKRLTSEASARVRRLDCHGECLLRVASWRAARPKRTAACLSLTGDGRLTSRSIGAHHLSRSVGMIFVNCPSGVAFVKQVSEATPFAILCRPLSCELRPCCTAAE